MSSLARYTSVCFAMRADVLAMLFITRRFHVVYSPFVTNRAQPVAISFMDRFGPHMVSITIELDFTKLGGNCCQGTEKLNPVPGLQRVAELVDGFAGRQQTRSREASIRELRVLVRRYHGVRPTAVKNGAEQETQDGMASPSSLPYTADADLAMVLSPVKRLRGLVDTLTITGAPKDLAEDPVLALSGKDHPLYSDEIRRHELDAHCTWRYPAREYPLTPGANQSSMLDYGPKIGGLTLVRHDRDGGGWEGKYGCRMVPEPGVDHVAAGASNAGSRSLVTRNAEYGDGDVKEKGWGKVRSAVKRGTMPGLAGRRRSELARWV